MKLKKIYSLSLATVLLATPACTITTMAQENTVSHNLTTVTSPLATGNTVTGTLTVSVTFPLS